MTKFYLSMHAKPLDLTNYLTFFIRIISRTSEYFTVSNISITTMTSVTYVS